MHHDFTIRKSKYYKDTKYRKLNWWILLMIDDDYEDDIGE